MGERQALLVARNDKADVVVCGGHAIGDEVDSLLNEPEQPAFVRERVRLERPVHARATPITSNVATAQGNVCVTKFVSRQSVSSMACTRIVRPLNPGRINVLTVT